LVTPAHPTYAEAAAALLVLRRRFCTFPFADAPRRRDDAHGVDLVDVSKPPGEDESAFLLAMITAVCRPSLWLVPGFLVTSPKISGAGTGKGLLVRAICTTAFGTKPRAFTPGRDRDELDKRLAAELIEAHPFLFLDNANGVALRSDLLASVLTERPARIRILGKTQMIALNSTAFVAITGNGLSVTEDLARRFIESKFMRDARIRSHGDFPRGPRSSLPALSGDAANCWQPRSRSGGGVARMLLRSRAAWRSAAMKRGALGVVTPC
jgi:hypothetical protein